MAKMIQFGKASLRSIIHAHRRSPTPTSGTSTTTAKSPFVHPLWVESTKISQPTVLFGFDMLPVRFDSASLLDRQFQNETQCYGKFPDMSRIEARGGPIKIDDDEDNIDSFDDDDDDDSEDFSDIDEFVDDDDDKRGSDEFNNSHSRSRSTGKRN
ncbi:hypothetical protein LguiB_036150 [Lonicera macranthoides]